mmetsp:Transcript_5933/g.14760  ORF Transcript_5933/g.14760 Transcript_5933/m.14760 type:complete len:280 (+) Transcript_5933:850-1689(+)
MLQDVCVRDARQDAHVFRHDDGQEIQAGFGAVSVARRLRFAQPVDGIRRVHPRCDRFARRMGQEKLARLFETGGRIGRREPKRQVDGGGNRRVFDHVRDRTRGKARYIAVGAFEVPQYIDEIGHLQHADELAQRRIPQRSGLHIVFDQGIKSELDGNPGVKDNDFTTGTNDAETIVRIEKSADGLPARFSDHFRFVRQLKARPYGKIVGPCQGIVVVLLLLLLLMKIHSISLLLLQPAIFQLCAFLCHTTQTKFRSRNCLRRIQGTGRVLSRVDDQQLA